MQRTRFQTRYNQAGFSLLELVIVIIIISALLAIGINKLMKLQVQAERAAMESIIGNLQSAIALTISEYIAKDNIPGLRRYIASNPMDLLATQPTNYKGSFPTQPKNQELASWWFNSRNRHLYYKVSNQEYFSTVGAEKGLIKFKILAIYDDKNGNGRFDQGDIMKGLRLTPAAKYRWLNEPIDPDSYRTESVPSQRNN